MWRCAPTLGRSAKAQAERGRTPIGDSLVGKFKSGVFTYRALRDGARAAGSSAGDVGKLVSRYMGTMRTNRGNVKADTRPDHHSLQRFNRTQALLLEPYVAEIPVWDAEQNAQVMRPMKVYPPHESLDALVRPGSEA